MAAAAAGGGGTSLEVCGLRSRLRPFHKELKDFSRVRIQSGAVRALELLGLLLPEWRIHGHSLFSYSARCGTIPKHEGSLRGAEPKNRQDDCAEGIRRDRRLGLHPAQWRARIRQRRRVQRADGLLRPRLVSERHEYGPALLRGAPREARNGRE